MLPVNPKDITALYQRALALQKSGQGDEALGIFQRILLARPQTPEVLFQVGRLHAAAGKAEKAEDSLRKALALKPKEAAIWQALHGVLRGAKRSRLEREAARARIALGTEAEARPILKMLDRGELEQAERAAMALVRSAPDAAWPALALGLARADRGRWPGAVGPLQMARHRAPENELAQFKLGQALARTKHPIAAEAELAPLAPRMALAARELARVWRDTLRLEEARALLLDVTTRHPDLQWGFEDLSLVAADLQDRRLALRAARCAIELGADPLATYRNLAVAFTNAGDAASGLAAIATGLERLPDHPGLLTHRAQIAQSAGNLAEAEADLTSALAADPANSEAFRSYTAGRRMREDDPLLSQLMSQLARPDISNPARRELNFAAAKAMGDLGRISEVFPHLDRANRLMSEAFPYDFNADLAEAKALVADWSRLEPLTPDAPDDPVYFVTGLPRSGTTLVETILASHSRVSAGGEMAILNRALMPAMESLRNGTPDPTTFATAGERYLDAGRRRAGGAVFSDKTISTFSRIGHAARALPGARFVILRRDPRDMGLSMYRNMFAEGRHRYTTDLTSMGRYIRLQEAISAFWQQAMPDRVHFVDYEALTAGPDPQIRALVTFCGLPWEDACLAPERSQRRVETLSFAQVRKPIGRQAVAGWRTFEAELAPLIKAMDETRIDLEVTL